MPKPYPKEFRDEVVRVARSREPGVRIKDIASDFGITESCLTNWLARADRDDGLKPGPTTAELTELREVKKRALGLARGAVSGGVLVVPSNRLAPYLTDRIGNLRELVPYFPLWSSVAVECGYLGVIAVEQDGESFEVPRIPKGTDGRAMA